MALARKLPSKICKQKPEMLIFHTLKAHKVFLHQNSYNDNFSFFFFCSIQPDEIEAHNSKVTCLDIGETGRVLVTGGQDRLVNLFAFGNNDCSMVRPVFLIENEMKKYVEEKNKIRKERNNIM